MASGMGGIDWRLEAGNWRGDGHGVTPGTTGGPNGPGGGGGRLLPGGDGNGPVGGEGMVGGSGSVSGALGGGSLLGKHVSMNPAMGALLQPVKNAIATIAIRLHATEIPKSSVGARAIRRALVAPWFSLLPSV